MNTQSRMMRAAPLVLMLSLALNVLLAFEWWDRANELEFERDAHRQTLWEYDQFCDLVWQDIETRKEIRRLKEGKP